MIFKPVNYYIFSRPDVVSALTIPGRSFDSFDDADAPIFSANEQPESDVPYVVWNSSRKVDRTRWWVQEQMMAYWIWDTNHTRLYTIEDKIINHIKAMDESAQLMNMWWYTQGFDDYKALFTRFISSDPVYPERQEGGVVGKLIRFSVFYVDCVLPTGTTT